MTPVDFDVVAGLALRHAGLSLKSDRAFFAEARLAPIARREGLNAVEDLVQALRGAPEPALVQAVVEALAPQETFFFRDRAVFEQLRTAVLPALSARREGRPLRIWSAGCATGQEVYSLAMIAADLGAVPVELFASDLSERALQKARSGLYTHFEVQRGLPIRMLLKWFEKSDDLWRVSPRLRQGVRWAQINLAGDLSRFGPFDVILCRNVLNAFDADSADRALDGLEGALAPDGLLVLGAAERPILPAAFTGDAGVWTRNPAYKREAA